MDTYVRKDAVHILELKFLPVLGVVLFFHEHELSHLRCSGKMIPNELERRVLEVKKRKQTPFLVSATMGNTVLGAFDSLDKIADICERYDFWMHVDVSAKASKFIVCSHPCHSRIVLSQAAWGGGVLLSRKYKHPTKGIHRADSVTWNLHKLMGVTLQSAAFLTNKTVSMITVASAHVLAVDRYLITSNFIAGSIGDMQFHKGGVIVPERQDVRHLI